MSQIRESLQELRERRFAGDLEKLNQQEADLLRERNRIKARLNVIRQKRLELEQQRESNHGSTRL